MLIFYYIAYIAIVSVYAVIITVYDKIAAKSDLRRISEKNLLLTGLAGGALSMFITMKLIRHKTLHAKFMILLPLMFIFHVVIAYFIAGEKLYPELPGVIFTASE